MNFSHKIKGWMTHPNTLSLYRVAAVPGIVVLMIYPNPATAFFCRAFVQPGGHHRFF